MLSRISFHVLYGSSDFMHVMLIGESMCFSDFPRGVTAMLIDREAMYAREAWAFSEDRSLAIAAHVRTLETQVAALIAHTSSLQTQLTTALGRIEILKARDPEPPGGTS
nr:hypothetical protein [Tanacetum cinerariifolium]